MSVAAWQSTSHLTLGRRVARLQKPCHMCFSEVRTPWFGTTGLPCTSAAATRNRASAEDLNHSLWPLTSATKTVQRASVFSRYSSGVICCCQHTHVWAQKCGIHGSAAPALRTGHGLKTCGSNYLSKIAKLVKGDDVEMLPAAHADIHLCC